MFSFPAVVLKERNTTAARKLTLNLAITADICVSAKASSESVLHLNSVKMRQRLLYTQKDIYVVSFFIVI